jgi:gamma-glutamyltranspeptidase/glutathione hydrolase
MQHKLRWRIGLSLSILLLFFGCQNKNDEIFNREAIAQNYMIATQGRHSTQAAEEMFSQGGNIFDAFAAISFAISVERPQSTGLGGGGFLTYFQKDMKEPMTVDFRERAPFAAHDKMFLDKDGNDIVGKSLDGIFAVGVPGLVAGVIEVHEKLGKLPLKKVIAPAIALAEKGFPVYGHLAKALKDRETVLGQYPESRNIFFGPDGFVLKEGDLLKQKNLAKTLKLIAEKGKKVFYQGELAQAILATSKLYQGLLTQKDFDEYQVVWRAPVKGTYKGHDIYSMGPPSSGGLHVIQILNMLENDDLKSSGSHSAKTVHLTAAAMQSAFADRAAYLGDSDFVKVPIAGILSKKYAQDLRAKIKDKARKVNEVGAGNPLPYESDETTHFTIMDKDGNTISSTQTINGWMGSGLTVPGTGIVLNNEMDDFATKAKALNLYGAVGGEKNLVAPGKRPLSSMSPTIVFKNDRPVLALGTASGTRILTCVTQTILNYLEHGLSLSEAVNKKRYHHQWQPDLIRVDSGFDLAIIAELKNLGYEVKEMDLGCSIQAVAWENGQLIGVSDSRGEGMSLGK